MSYELIDYDGSLIHKRFAYSLLKKRVSEYPLGWIFASRGKMEVTENLIDLEDKMQNDFIYSDDALSFCWEIPNMNPLGAVFFQRLFVQEIAALLSSGAYGKYDVEVHGDDLMMRKHGMEEFGKASVSITKVTDSIALGHLGINISAGDRAPKFAFSLFLTDEQAKNFSKRIQNIFYDILDDVYIATTKVI